MALLFSHRVQTLAATVVVVALLSPAGVATLRRSVSEKEGRVERDRVEIESGGSFSCPGECQECCPTPNYRSFFGNFGTSGTKFKCVLKKKRESEGDEVMLFDLPALMTSLPAGRKCSDPVARAEQGQHAQAKTECEFTETERSASAWSELQPCSTRSKCCCETSADWTERVCLAPEVTDKTHREVSAHSGKTEVYERLEQSVDNHFTPCVGEGHVALSYQKTPTGDLTTQHYGTTGSCCLATTTKHITKNVLCRGKSTGSGHGGHNGVCSTRVPWTACAEFEKLYHCGGPVGSTSEQRGAEKTGQLYKRVQTEQGVCVGDHSTPERAYKRPYALELVAGECPAGYSTEVAGKACECPVACGA